MFGKGVTMNTILIDNEQQELNLLHKKIIRLSNIEVLGAFTDPHEGLIEVSKHQPDVLFLDISIPEVNWIKVTKQLKNAMPEMSIVFLAIGNEHAIKAFDIQVADYLLKPVVDTRLQKTLSKIMNKRETREPESHPMIGCFKKMNFRYYESDKDTLNVNWRTSKAREIFAYLVHKRGELVRKDVLADLFWPESNIKDAFGQLYSTIYQIRKSLGSIDFDIQIINLENSYKLALNNYLVDVDVWEESMKRMPLITDDNVETHKNLLYLYKGAYFEEENYMWSMNERERLRVKWIYQMKRVVNFYLSIDFYEEVILLYLFYQKVNPFIIESYVELMKLYAYFEDWYAVEEQYHLLKEMLEEEFNDEPDESVVAWYENWRRGI